MKKSVQLAALRQQVAPPAFTDYWAPMNGFVGQLAARRPQVALRRRLPMDWPLDHELGKIDLGDDTTCSRKQQSGMRDLAP